MCYFVCCFFSFDRLIVGWTGVVCCYVWMCVTSFLCNSCVCIYGVIVVVAVCIYLLPTMTAFNSQCGEEEQPLIFTWLFLFCIFSSHFFFFLRFVFFSLLAELERGDAGLCSTTLTTFPICKEGLIVHFVVVCIRG